MNNKEGCPYLLIFTISFNTWIVRVSNYVISFSFHAPILSKLDAKFSLEKKGTPINLLSGQGLAITWITWAAKNKIQVNINKDPESY